MVGPRSLLLLAAQGFFADAAEPAIPAFGTNVVIIGPDTPNPQDVIDNIFSEKHARYPGKQPDWKSRDYFVYDLGDIGGLPGGFFVEGAAEPELCEREQLWCRKELFGGGRGRHFDTDHQSRVHVFLLPGEYDVTVSLGYYQQYQGLGKDKKDVRINKLQVLNGWENGGNGLNNFWRAAEGMTVKETSRRNIAAFLVQRSSATVLFACYMRQYFEKDVVLTAFFCIFFNILKRM